MIIVKLWGGMCNQMFQYAFGYALAKKHQDMLCFDVDFYDNQPSYVGKRNLIGQHQYPLIENIPTKKRPFLVRFIENKYLSHIIRYNFGCNFKVGKLNIIIERLHKHYEKIPYKKDVDNFYDGYWQSADYFKGFEDEIRKLFTPTKEIDLEVKEWRRKVNSNCCVAVHIRRGDYLNAINKGIKNTVDDNGYYLQAIEIMQQKFKHPTFCFFSDDIEWCKNTFGSMLPTAVFVNRKDKNSALFDLFAIAQCEHGIMSQSTFSWWGNWLRKHNHDSIVIYPEGDYSEKFITADNWIELEIK